MTCATHPIDLLDVSLERCLSELWEAVGSYGKQRDSALAARLDAAIDAVVAELDGVWLRNRRDRLPDVLKAARALRQTRFSEGSAPPERVAAAADFMRKGGSQLICSMLMAPSWQLPQLPNLNSVPTWLWPEFIDWVVDAPTFGAREGSVDTFIRHATALAEDLAGWLERNRGSRSILAAAHALAAKDTRSIAARSSTCTARLAKAVGRIVQRLTWTSLAHAPLERDARAGRKIRIGFMIDAVRNDWSGNALAAHLRHLDPIRFETGLFVWQSTGTATETACRAVAAQWRILAGSLEEQVELCRGAQLDVLVFATDPASQPFHLAPLGNCRLAPLQIVLPNTFETTGLAEIDLRLVGQSVGVSSGSERLAHLPGSGFLFDFEAESARGRITRNDLGIAANGCLFASATAPDHIGPELLRAWGGILEQQPTSSLVIFLPATADPFLAETLPQVLAQMHSVDGGRVRVSFDDLHRGLELADIYLDTFPVSSAAGLAHALWLGLPAVTLRGDHPRERIGAAILHEHRAGEAVAESPTEYIRLATEWSQRGHPAPASPVNPPVCNALFADPALGAELMGHLYTLALEQIEQMGPGAFRSSPHPLVPDLLTLEDTLISGEEGLALGELENATRHSLTVLHHQPDSIAARTLLGRTLVAQGQAERGLLHLLRCLNGREDDPKYWLTVAGALRTAQRTNEAIAAYEAALKLDPSQAEGWIAIAEMALVVGHHEIAADAAKVARTLVPSDPRLQHLPA